MATRSVNQPANGTRASTDIVQLVQQLDAAGAVVSGTATVVQPSAASAAVTQVASSATNVTLKAANASRKGLSVYNDSTQALFLKFGATASATSYTVKIPADGFYEMPASPVYTGIVDGLWVSANGNAYVTEV